MDKERLREFLRRYKLLPSFNEVSLYLMSLTFLLVLFSNTELRAQIISDYQRDPDSIRLFVVFGVVAIYAIVNAFINRVPSDIEKILTLYFVVGASIAINGIAAVYVLKHSSGLIIFPLINVLSIFYLFVLLREKIIDSRDMSDEQAKLPEVLIGTVAVLCIFYYSHIVAGHYYAVTYSICTAYATTINNIVTKFSRRRIFPGSP